MESIICGTPYRRHQAAKGKKQRPRYVAVFGQLSVKTICLTAYFRFLRAARIRRWSLDLSMPVRELIARKMEDTGVIRGFIPMGRSGRASL
jgi:hypothetical protein